MSRSRLAGKLRTPPVACFADQSSRRSHRKFGAVVAIDSVVMREMSRRDKMRREKEMWKNRDY